jgi:hypothetical protein
LLAQSPTRPREDNSCSLFAPYTEQARYALYGMDIAPVDLYCWQAPILPASNLQIYEHLQEKCRADERTRTAFLLITSVRSVVAEHCTGLQIPHRQRVFSALYCPLLQGIASGLGSN